MVNIIRTKRDKNINFYITIVIIFLIIFFSVILKFKKLDIFTDPENFFTTHDAFRHARYAIEIQNNTYGKIDYLADVPDFGINQYPPPLLSLMAAMLSYISGIQIQYYFLVLPPFLSVFFVIPFYFWLKPFENLYLTYGGITLGLFNVQYFLRTNLGYFYTDCLMLFFVFTVILFITKAVCEKDNQFKSYFFLLLAGLSMSLFRWWYEHLFFTLIFLFSLLIGLTAWRHSLKDILLKSLFFIALSSPIELFYYIINSPFLKDYFYGTIMNIEGFRMPINIYAATAELQPVSINNFIKHTTDNTGVLIVAIVGFLMLFVRNFRYMLTMLPIIAIGFSALYSGYRYLIFLCPFIGIGIGYSIYLFYGYLINKFPRSNKAVYVGGIIVVIFLSFPAQRLFDERKPSLEKRQVNNFIKIKDLTERDAYIWSWWGLGNAIQYYSQRSTFMDNMYFSPLKAYVILKSMLSDGEDATYKSISFLTNNRVDDYKGLKHDLPVLLEKINSYKLEPINPVYILLHLGVLSRLELNDHSLPKDEADSLARKLPFMGFQCDIEKNMIADCESFLFNLKNNSVDIKNNNINIGYKKIAYYNKQAHTKRDFPLNPKAKHVMYLILSKDGLLRYTIAHEDFERTMLFKMLIASENEFKHFELVHEDYPHMVLYRVK